MSAITAFEVQSFRNGTWKIETITDSKDLAVHQAEQVILNPAIHKVRVVQEAFDPASAEQKFRVVFIRDKKPAQQSAQPPMQQPAQAASASAEPSQTTQAARAAPKAKQGASAVGLVLKFGLIVCAGIAIIIALRYFGASL